MQNIYLVATSETLRDIPSRSFAQNIGSTKSDVVGPVVIDPLRIFLMFPRRTILSTLGLAGCDPVTGCPTRRAKASWWVGGWLGGCFFVNCKCGFGHTHLNPINFMGRGFVFMNKQNLDAL